MTYPSFPARAPSLALTLAMPLALSPMLATPAACAIRLRPHRL
jgi:hypothetical protein